MSAYYLAIDQGGHASRAIVFDDRGEIQTQAEIAIDTFTPRAGWVEHDAAALLKATQQAIETALDLDALASALNDVHSEQDVASPWPEVRVTTDAGAYVCNAIYYYSLCAHPGNRVVFVHLPMQSAEVAFRQGELLGEAMLRLTWEGAGSRLTLNV